MAKKIMKNTLFERVSIEYIRTNGRFNRSYLHVGQIDDLMFARKLFYSHS